MPPFGRQRLAPRIGPGHESECRHRGPPSDCSAVSAFAFPYYLTSYDSLLSVLIVLLQHTTHQRNLVRKSDRLHFEVRDSRWSKKFFPAVGDSFPGGINNPYSA